MASVYEIITARVVEQLERGTVPWHKPWAGEEGIPQNAISRKPYRGINVFLLSCTSFESPAWLTFKQAQSLGGSVRKGERGYPVVYWNWFKKADQETGELVELPFLRYYTVFNVAQCDGIPADKLPPKPEPRIDFKPIEACQRVLADLPANQPSIQHGHASAFYRPSADLVAMPSAEYFDSPEHYYATLFHELTHSTGHASRLSRKGIMETTYFGSGDYSREELIAEMGSAFLCGHCSIDTAPIQENEAAYLANWLRVLRGDSKLIVTAAAQAQKAADWLLNRKPEEQAE